MNYNDYNMPDTIENEMRIYSDTFRRFILHIHALFKKRDYLHVLQVIIGLRGSAVARSLTASMGF